MKYDLKVEEPRLAREMVMEFDRRVRLLSSEGSDLAYEYTHQFGSNSPFKYQDGHYILLFTHNWPAGGANRDYFVCYVGQTDYGIPSRWYTELLDYCWRLSNSGSATTTMFVTESMRDELLALSSDATDNLHMVFGFNERLANRPSDDDPGTKW